MGNVDIRKYQLVPVGQLTWSKRMQPASVDLQPSQDSLSPITVDPIRLKVPLVVVANSPLGTDIPYNYL